MPPCAGSNPAAPVTDEELREAMKESGLGTPATRAETIETLIRREYIERAGKDLTPTPKGLQVITMLEEHPLTSPELTGDWEKRLTDIERGDVILEIDRRPIRSVDDYDRAIAAVRPGDVLAFYVYKPSLDERRLSTVRIDEADPAPSRGTAAPASR